MRPAPASTALAAAFAVALLAAPLAAQIPPPPPLPEPGKDAPAPAPYVAQDPDLEPQVTIIRREGETREEVRVGGQLRFIRVTPAHGRPYYLVPQADGTSFIRRSSLDPQLSVPMWMLFSW